MNTYGLNRHLNSFGLSYPGYWFIIVEEGGGSVPFVAYGDTGYIARELQRLYPAHSITLYEAYPGGVAIVTREFAATEDRTYITIGITRLLLAQESYRFMAVESESRYFIAIDESRYIATESNRAFTAKGNREYDSRSS